MAAAAPSGPTPMQTDSQGSVPPLSWEGDKMFNIYIHDYCTKHGFTKTARELMHEAQIPSDATPPINAKQGLLFEWWSVFWVLFQAKSNGGGSEDGLIYTHHQSAQRVANQRLQSQNNGLGNPPLPGSQQPPPPPLPQQQNMGGSRLVNGIPPGPGNMQQPAMTRPPSTMYMVNGPMTNGVGMNPGGMGGQPPPQHLQPGQPGQGMPPGGSSMSFNGMGVHHGGPLPPQPNGVPGPQQQQQPGPQMQFAMMGGQQRPMMNGMPPQQQRGGPNPNGGAPPFQSPTMAHAHSPQHNPGGPPQQQGQGLPGQAPMAQLGGPGPSPHLMNRGMLPPPLQNGGAPLPPGMGPGPQQQPPPGGQQGPPTPGYQQGGGRPPSRTNTPRSGIMSHAIANSPSLASRQPPGQGPQQGGPGSGPMVGVIPGGSGGGAGGREDAVNAEIMQIPQNQMDSLKQELGLGDKNLSSLNMLEKNRILTSWKQRNGSGQQQQRKDGPGPSGMMGQPGQQQQQGRPGQPPQQRIKRSSTSPGEEHDSLPRNESSPPERKRVRRSPAEPPAITNPYSHHPQHPQQQQQGQPQQGHPPQQQQQPGQQGPPGQQPSPQQLAQQQHHQAIMMGRMPMNGMPMPGGPPPGHPGGPPQQQQGIPQGLMGMGMPGGMSQSQLNQLYRINKGIAPPQPGGGPSDHSFNPGGPPSSGPTQFSSSPLNRIGQAKPSLAGMMPPPSPAMNGPPKDSKEGILNNGNKGPAGQQGNGPPPGQGHNPDGSPRGVPPLPGGPGGPGSGGGGGPSGGGGGTGPPTPGPGNQPGPPPPPQQQQQQNQLVQGGMMTSASGLLGMPPSGMGGPQEMGMFDPGAFMNLPDSLEFDPTMFRQDSGDINFERDFGQWFNPDDVVGPGLDGMK